MSGKRAVFLDRDGTLNHDPGYINDPEQLDLIDGVGESLRRLKRNGFELVVVSNQSGIARGKIKPDVLPLIHQRLNALLAKDDVQIDHFVHCPHHPDDRCDCRKPKPGMLLRAADEFGIDLSQSYMVGDRAKDVQAGKAARVRAALMVKTGDGSKSDELSAAQDADWIGDDLSASVEWILSQENANS